MITDPTFSRELSAAMLDIGSRLDALVAKGQARLPDAEFERFRRAIGSVMGSMLLDVMTPLYAAHPELKPTGLT